MGDMLSDGAAWLADQMAASVSRTCAYKRGANTTQFTATIGRSVFESAGQNGVQERWEARDYIVRVDDLPYGEPQRGDFIVEELNGESYFYEVASPRGIPLFHYADAFQNAIRIHTKQTDRDITFIIDDQGNEISVPLTAQE